MEQFDFNTQYSKGCKCTYKGVPYKLTYGFSDIGRYPEHKICGWEIDLESWIKSYIGYKKGDIVIFPDGKKYECIE